MVWIVVRKAQGVINKDAVTTSWFKLQREQLLETQGPSKDWWIFNVFYLQSLLHSATENTFLRGRSEAPAVLFLSSAGFCCPESEI